MKFDSDIQDEVVQELRWDRRVDDTELDVDVSDGVATLSGTVGTFAERQAAQEAAFRVYGVHDVANEIQVQMPRHLIRTDADLAQAVRAALEWDVRIPSDRIRSSVTDGVVTLYGVVDDWHAVAAAEAAVGNLAGVQDVLSDLTVSVPHVDAETVQRDIEQALERRADRAAHRVTVEVHEGVVTLRGTLHSPAERHAVLGAARFTHGVRQVEDRLRVEHPEEMDTPSQRAPAQASA